MTRASMGRRLRVLRKRQRSSAVQSGSPKDPKPYEEVPVEYGGKYYINGSEAVKPAGPLVRMYVSAMLDVSARNRSK